MSEHFQQVGFSRLIRLDWLEYTSNLVVAGNEGKDIYEALDEYLKDILAVGNNKSGSVRDRTIRILTKIWVNNPPRLKSLSIRGLNLLQGLSTQEQLLIHFSMCMATYPFLKMVSESIGRLLKLQETTTTSQIQRRIREKYGERETVSKSVQRIIASFVDWGVLERRDRGIYGSKGVMQIENKELIVWLVEAMLHTIPSGRSSLQEILHSPSLFAFSFDWIPVDVLTGSNQLEVVRHGLDRELLILKEQ